MVTLQLHVPVSYPPVTGLADARAFAVRETTRAERLPVVLTREEVRAILRELQGPPRLMAILLYGAGLRLLRIGRSGQHGSLGGRR